MPRSSLVAAWILVAAAGPARAGELPRSPGLYPPSGPALALVDSDIEIAVRGPIVEAVVTQRFRNASDHATEATYIFPLPRDAAVTAMAIRSGSRTIRAAIERRDEAQRRYEAAVRAGVAGALLDQERDDVFTQTVTAIPARGQVEITLRFDTVARFQDGSYELVVPLVVAPRFVPGAATGRGTTGAGRAPDTDRAPDASRVTPPGAPGAGGATDVALRFAEPPLEVTSPSHELKVAGAQVAFSDPRTDHDAIVRWRPRDAAGGWVETGAGGEGYAAVVVSAPPAPARRGATRFTLVLDRSASSLGDADATAHPIVRGLLGALAASDRVAVIGSDQLGWAAPADVARALERTWPVPAGPFDLTRVLAAARPDGAPVVLVSGGLVADDGAAIAAARKLGVPVHVIGVGPAPARGALTQLAAATGGTVRFAIAGDDLGALARATLADAASPPPPLAVTWGTLAASDVVPRVLPRLGAGQAMLVLARVRRAHTANGRAGGELFAIEPIAPARAVDGATSAAGPLARRWARERLDELLTGSPDVAAVIAHAQRYGLVSPYTSMVAIGDEVVVQGGVKRSVAIPVSVPAGMKWQAVKRETAVDLDSAADQVSRRTVTRDVKPDPVVRDHAPASDPQPARRRTGKRGGDDARKVPSPKGAPPAKKAPPPEPVDAPAPPDAAPRAPRAPAPEPPPPPSQPPPVRPAPATAPEPPTASPPPARRAPAAVPEPSPPNQPPATAAVPEPPPRPSLARPPSPRPSSPRPSSPRPSSPRQAPPRPEPQPVAEEGAPNADVLDRAGAGAGTDREEDDASSAREPSRSIAAASPEAAESVMATGRAPSLLGPSWRLTASLGGGVVRSGGETASLFDLGARIERGGRTLLGFAASLRLADTELAARALVTFARTGVTRWLELGAGLGVHLGDGVGPAAALGLRYHLPPLPRLAGYLRYDGALVLDGGERRGDHAATLGLELGF